MRKALAAREGERATYQGTVERFGTKSGWRGRRAKTILLKGICDATGKPIYGHQWFNLTQAFAALNLQPGDTVAFDARVEPYEKGYFGPREDVYKPAASDYKLSYPTRVRKVGSSGT
jgi:hypothetical protein